MKLLIATFNHGKREEFKRIIQDIAKSKKISVTFLFPEDFDINKSPQEKGNSFAQISAAKAKYFFELSKIPVLADDGGLQIDALGGAPGIHSRRWPGYKMSDDQAIKYVLKKMMGYRRSQQRSARLTACITYYDGKNLVQQKASIEGFISHKPLKKYSPGYPYRAIFKVKKFDKYYQSLTDQEHDVVNHRRQALLKIFDKIKELHKIRHSGPRRRSVSEASLSRVE